MSFLFRLIFYPLILFVRWFVGEVNRPRNEFAAELHKKLLEATDNRKT